MGLPPRFFPTTNAISANLIHNKIIFTFDHENKPLYKKTQIKSMRMSPTELQMQNSRIEKKEMATEQNLY